tara:strand:- start:738 stop:881 length:144 start_codon:yes stop_codon:yes gene_type:complete
MFDDIWKDALLKAAPLMILVLTLTTISLLPAYMMKSVVLNQQQLIKN